MSDITTAESAYEAIARAVYEFPAARAWDFAFGRFEIFIRWFQRNGESRAMVSSISKVAVHREF